MPNWMKSLWKEIHPEMMKRSKIQGIFQSFGSQCAVERFRRLYSANGQSSIISRP